MSNFANPQEDINVLRMVLASGTAALPSVVFANDLTKGLSWTPDGLRLSGLAAPINNDDAASKAYVDAGGASFPLLAPDGSAAAPSYSFTSLATSGLWYDPVATAPVLSFQSGTSFYYGKNTTGTFQFEDHGFAEIGSSATLTIQAGTGIDGSGAYAPALSLSSGSLDVIALTATPINFGFSDTFTATAARLDQSATAGDTRLLLWDVDSGALQRVTVGAADSGGMGFKVLRIPN